MRYSHASMRPACGSLRERHWRGAADAVNMEYS
jgi:hypothetical protein